MRVYQLLVKEVKQESVWDYQDKEAVKLGEVAYDFKGKHDDEVLQFKKGAKIYYKYGNAVKIGEDDLVAVSLSALVKDYE